MKKAGTANSDQQLLQNYCQILMNSKNTINAQIIQQTLKNVQQLIVCTDGMSGSKMSQESILITKNFDLLVRSLLQVMQYQIHDQI